MRGSRNCQDPHIRPLFTPSCQCTNKNVCSLNTALGHSVYRPTRSWPCPAPPRAILILLGATQCALSPSVRRPTHPCSSWVPDNAPLVLPGAGRRALGPLGRRPVRPGSSRAPSIASWSSQAPLNAPLVRLGAVPRALDITSTALRQKIEGKRNGIS